MIPLDKFSHDLLIEVLRETHPTLTHGVDFIVAHYIKDGSTEQVGDPFFIKWSGPGKPPDVTLLKARYEMQAGKHKANLARRYRDACLADTDHKATHPADAPETHNSNAAAWAAYRQALRDITSQPGFPHDIQWPEMPT